MRIRSHLLLLALGSVLPVLAFAVFVTVLMVDREQRTFATAAVERIRGTMAAIDADIRGHETTLRALAGLGSLEAGNLDAFRADMQRVLATQPSWANITLARPDGEQLLNAASPDGKPAYRQARDPATIERAARAQSLAVGGVMYGRVTKELGITMAVPVVRGSATQYVLAAFVRTDDFLSIIAEQRLGEGWVTGVVDATGRFIARVPPPPSEFASEAFRVQVAQASEGWYRGATAEGRDSYSAHITSPLTGWSIGLGVPADEVLAGARRTGWLMGGGMALMLALAAMLASWLGQRVSRPVDAIAAQARALASGEDPPHAIGGRRIVELEGVVSALNDAAVAVRERQRLLEREKDLLQEADRAKDTFIAMLSHELRNPLAALTSASDLLERVPHDNEIAHRSRAIIKRQTRHMTRLIEDLLDVSRLVAGKVHLSSERFDLGEVARSVLNTWHAAGRLERHQVRTDVSNAWVEADRSRVEQILSNLLDNALKFSPAGTFITVKVRRDGSDAVLEVSDEGSGLSPEMLNTAFDLFVQGKQGLARETGGLGVGLALARQLADLQGGSITAASENGHGAAFELRLPAVAAAASAHEPGTLHSLHGKRRILVIEDNEDVRSALVALLKLKGHQVDQAADGNEGLRTADKVWPEIIFIDIGLPGIDGYEVARRLRTHGHDRTGLVALSGYGQTADKQQAADAGFDEHLTKPVTVEKIDEVIALLGQRTRAVGNG